jgi:predicted RNase H-like HicB family nuclease
MAGLVAAIHAFLLRSFISSDAERGQMALNFAVLIQPLSERDGGGYLATVPDLPGCMSDGETPEEALKNVQEAIASWIEAAKEWKQDVPKPSPPRAG